MNLSRLVCVLALILASASTGQARQKQATPCKGTPQAKGKLPALDHVKLRPGETYKRSPVVKFRINEDGSVSDVKLVRSSGKKDLDRQVIKAVVGWKYKPNPGCPMETEMSLTIDWR